MPRNPTVRIEFRVAYRNGMEPGGVLPYLPSLKGCAEGAFVEAREVWESEWSAVDHAA